MIFYFTTTNGNSGATIASSKSHVTGGNRVAGTSIPNVTDSLLFHPSHTPCTTRRARTHGRAHTRSHTRTHTTTAVAQFQPEAEGTFRRTHTSPFEARDAPARAPTHTRERGECEVRGAHTHTVPTHSAAPDTRTREFANTHTRTETRSLSFLSLCITPFIGRLVFTPSSSLFSFPGLHTLPRFCFVSSLSSTSIPSSRHAPPSSPTTVSNHHRQSFFHQTSHRFYSTTHSVLESDRFDSAASSNGPLYLCIPACFSHRSRAAFVLDLAEAKVQSYVSLSLRLFVDPIGTRFDPTFRRSTQAALVSAVYVSLVSKRVSIAWGETARVKPRSNAVKIVRHTVLSSLCRSLSRIRIPCTTNH